MTGRFEGAEQGTHQELLQKGGKYADLIARQLQFAVATTGVVVTCIIVVLGIGRPKAGLTAGLSAGRWPAYRPACR